MDNLTAGMCLTNLDCIHVHCSGDASIDEAFCSENGHCECESRAWFFITFGVYLSIILGVAIFSRATAPPAEVVSPEEGLRQHFMASGNFGTFVMTLTIFSTAFSGYTVVGVPNESSTVGFVALRWLAITITVNVGVLILFPRLREIGTARGYDSPTDFIADRFNCNSLRLTSAIVFVAPLYIYTTVQFKSIIDIIDGLSLGRVDKHAVAVVICIIIVACEWIGGQRSVSLSDAAQASIMLVAFMTMPFVIVYYYGGLDEIIPEGCETYPNCVGNKAPWMIRTPSIGGYCPASAYTSIGWSSNETAAYPDNLAYASCDERTYALPEAFTNENCMASQFANGTTWADDVHPLEKEGAMTVDVGEQYHYATVGMFGFIFNAIAFPLNPHFMQKVFVAKNTEVLKRSLMLMCFGALVVNLPSAYYGFVTRAELQEEQCEDEPRGTKLKTVGAAFPQIAGELINKGGFAEFISVIASCSALAAVMSTCDSTLIGANNVVTVELVQNWLWKSATHVQLEYFSMAFTPVFAVLALIFAFASEGVPFSTLINLQNSFVWQVFPTACAAIYTDFFSGHCLLLGEIVGLAVTIAIEISISQNPGKDGVHFYLPSGLYAITCNTATVVASQLVCNALGLASGDDSTRTFDTVRADVKGDAGAMSSWMKQGRLTAHGINTDILDGVTVPLDTRLGKILTVGAMVVICLGLPWFEGPYTKQTVVAGMPAFASIFFTFYLVALAMIVYAFWLWKPRPEPEEEDTSASPERVAENASYKHTGSADAAPTDKGGQDLTGDAAGLLDDSAA